MLSWTVVQIFFGCSYRGFGNGSAAAIAREESSLKTARIFRGFDVDAEIYLGFSGVKFTSRRWF